MIPWQAFSAAYIAIGGYAIWVCLTAPWLKGWDNLLILAAGTAMVVLQSVRLIAWGAKRFSPA